MMYSVYLSQQAEIDLRVTFEYIAFELKAPQNAAHQLARLERQIVGLSDFPERYRCYEKEPWKSRGLRIMPVDRYLVFYIVDSSAYSVEVVRVMYSGRDIETHLE